MRWIDGWIEDYLGIGATIDDVMVLVAKWLANRKTIDALRVTAAAIVHAGRRKDIDLLDVAVAPQELADEIRANTEYAVRRRTLV
ncbi:hypothetical protein SAMN05216338_100972 [Bradyrhizobium sp. Rc2d]|uniref:hypothetical protein n=1 Tax=Bradyrhizobium sp. Rc2d TaxID=1855321 RepID=UPI000884F4ED|nr:hypothetical protein [Bradyrhizobium sp. Rc2d]SDH43401.1 hypothetical protein SAMN05216338_100972 [Bradyrhizobium sp. Rc2d]